MNEEKALEISYQIFERVLGEKVSFSLQDIYDKFAFDCNLPYEVKDSTTGEVTWADSINFDQYITLKNSETWEREGKWKGSAKKITSFSELMECFHKLNYVTTERVYDSLNVCKSDTIYRSQNVYHSTNTNDSSSIVFCNSVGNSEYLLASSRSYQCNYCISTDDSANCTNCYHVICSGKVSNSLFIQDCSDLNECMFCAHIANESYCICNTKYSPEEYYAIKKVIVEWILHS